MNLIEKNERMKELIEMLNKYRDAYYNQTESLVSDYEKCMPSRVIDKRMDSCEMIRYMIQKQIWKENIKRGKK